MNSPHLQIIRTADGSNTVFNATVGENYHSKNGALQESRHVFLETGLLHFLKQNSAIQASVLEVGFGTGLNFLLSADYCTKNQIRLNYTGIEAYPLNAEMISQTGYDEYVSGTLWQSFVDQYMDSMNQMTNIDEYCRLELASSKLLNFQSDKKFDVIYFDAFASAYQPEMWNEAAISHTAQFVNPGGVFVTYAITGNLKRQLKSLGFVIEKVPGAAGKREMLRATRLA